MRPTDGESSLPLEIDSDERELLRILLQREHYWSGEVKGLSRFPDMQAAMDKRITLVEGLLEKVGVENGVEQQP